MSQIEVALDNVLNHHEIYMRKVGEMLDFVQDNESAFESALKALEQLKEIREIVKETKIFKDSKRQIESFIKIIKNETPDKKLRIEKAWLHFMERLANAPTRLNMIGVVILCVPVVCSLVLEYIEELNV